MRARLFPGDRQVWVGAAVVVAVGLALLGAWLFQGREVVIGSTAVAPRVPVVAIPPEAQMCARGMDIPDGTGRIRTWVLAQPGAAPSFDLELRVRGGETMRGHADPAPTGKTLGSRDITLDRPVSGAEGGSVVADLCVTAHDAGLRLGGMVQLGADDHPLEVGDRRIHNRLALTFLPTSPETKPVIAQLSTVFEHASLFRPGWVGPWTLWAIMFVVFPFLAYAAIRVLATAETWSARLPLALAVALLSFGHSATWAVFTPAYQSPDESEHYAYVEHLAETGNTPGSPGTQGRAPWASDVAVAIDASHLLTTLESPKVDLPWASYYENSYKDRVAAQRLRRDDGGGAHPVNISHSPLYYSLLAPAYYAARGGSVFDGLLMTRLTSALMGAVTVLFAFLLIAELLPGRRAYAAAGGLMVGFVPMFGFISGSVNNDNGVNMAAAAIAFLTIRMLKRGPTLANCAWLGIALGLAPLFKGTGYALYPCVALAIVCLILRLTRFDPRRLFSIDVLRRLAPIGAAMVAVAVIYFAWDALSPHFARDSFTTPAGGTPGLGFGARADPGGYATWIWQNLIPVKLPFMEDYTYVKWPFFNIYVQRAFASFGWYALEFPNWVYMPIVGVMAALVFGAGRAALRHRDWVRTNWVEALFVISVPVVVFLAIEAAYFPLAIPVDGTGEQGRYAFTAIAPSAAIAVAGCIGLGRERALQLASGLIAALIVLGYAGQWMILSRWFV